MTAGAIVSLLVEVSWRAVLVAALVGGVLLLWHVKGGAVRHAAWTLVMVAMLLMPALLAIAPEWQVPVRLPAMASSSSPIAIPEAPATRPDEVPLASSTVVAPTAGATANRASAAAQSGRPVAAEQDRVQTGRDWPRVALMIWLAGIVVNLAVMAVGWRMARRLVRGARTSEIDPRVLESPAVSAPCAVGVWRVSVVVPRVWRTWSRAGRDAVLQHEFAHVQRRDLFVAFLARLNRAVFWFNPIAWWLERRIAAAAEQACDEAVLLSGQDPQRYAAVLIEMAGALRRGGRRVAWQSIGIADRGDLESRVDRVLTGDVPRLSRWRAAGVVSMSVAALIVAVACQQAQAPAPLLEDPVVADTIRRNQERTAEFEAAQKMSMAEATALAAQFGKDPNDLAAARRLLTFYRDRGQALMGWNEMVSARRVVLLSLIERNPEASETYWPITRRLDPEGYDRARSLWMAQTAKPGVTARVLGNAAFFFRAWEPEIAERLLTQAETIDTGGPTPRVVNGVAYTGWRARLGELYAYWVVGATEENLYNTIQAVSAERAATPFAVHARRTLDASTDPKLLGPAGLVLSRSVPWVPEQGQAFPPPGVLPFDPIALGRTYMERALAADPSLVHLQRNIAQYDRFIEGRAVQARAQQLLGAHIPTASLEAIAGLPVDVRMHLLPGMADMAFNSGEMREYYQKDTVGRDEFFKRARALADQSLALAAEMPNDPRSQGLRYTAHLVIGVVSLREGDQRRAVAELTAAADVAAASSVPLDDVAMMSSQKLPQYLLTHGERESVAAFYERAAPQVSRHTEMWTKAAAAIRAGKMPESYQYAQSRR